MSQDSNLIISIARQIVLKLDCLDGKDGKITSKVWNNIFNVKAKSGNEIRTQISLFNAEKSVVHYLNKLQGTQQSKQDIAANWLNSISDVQNDEVITVEKTINEIVVTPSKGNTIPPNMPDLSKKGDVVLPPIVEVPVSTYVAAGPDVTSRQLERTLPNKDETLDINEYVTLAKMTKTSSVKASEQPLHEDILDKAFDNVIRDLMRKGGKKRSVLLGTAKDFLRAAKAQNVDTFTLMGISMIESSYGTSKLALSKNNACGLTPNGHDGIHCATVADSINIGAKTLHNNVYNKGLDSINSVGMKGNYCCGNTVQRSNWVSNVMSFANKIKTEYNRLLSEMQNA